MLILGCGNPDRSDDAAGVLVARRLRELGIESREYYEEMLGLIEELSRSPEAVIVDAVMSGAAPGAVHIWDARNRPLPRDWFHCSTHDLGVADAVELARALGRLPSKLILYGIEAARFDCGESLSPDVAGAIERLAQDIAAQTRQPVGIGSRGSLPK
jgi:hydrogenase maturation protease